MEREEKTMNELLVAKAFLFVDDPYGYGIRLNHVRHPSPARIAAIDLVRTGQTSFNALPLMLAERGTDIFATLSVKSARASMVLNSDLTEAEANELRSAI